MTISLDCFEAPEFRSQSRKLPYAQVLNPGINSDGTSKPWGFAIEAENAEAAGFRPDDNWQYCPNYTFKSGNQAAIYTCQNPKVVFVIRGEILLEDRVTQEPRGPLFNGPFSQDYLANRQAYKPYTNNIVYFVDKDNKFLHDTPLGLKLGGATGGTLADEYAKYRNSSLVSGFCKELVDAYYEHKCREAAKAGNGTDSRPSKPNLDQSFFSYWVLNLNLGLETKGDASRSALVCVAKGHVAPTVDTIMNFLIHPQTEQGKQIAEIRELYHDYGKPDLSSPAQSSDRNIELNGVIVNQPKIVTAGDLRNYLLLKVEDFDRATHTCVIWEDAIEIPLDVIKQSFVYGVQVAIQGEAVPSANGINSVVQVKHLSEA